jgi:hypothetical protein
MRFACKLNYQAQWGASMKPLVANPGNNSDRPVWTVSVRRLGLIAGLTTLVLAALVPRPVRAGVTLIGSPVTAGGYAFTNFDFLPQNVAGTGNNVNGISNTGQVVGFAVDSMGNFTNFSGTPFTTLNQLNTGAGQMAFGINSAGNVVGGNGTNAFFLPNGGAPQTLMGEYSRFHTRQQRKQHFHDDQPARGCCGGRHQRSRDQ